MRDDERIHSLKAGIIKGIRGLYEIEREVLNFAKNTLSDTLKATGSVVNESLEVSKDAARNSLKAAEQVGETLVGSTRKLSKGIVTGVADVGSDAASMTCHAPKARGTPRPIPA